MPSTSVSHGASDVRIRGGAQWRMCRSYMAGCTASPALAERCPQLPVASSIPRRNDGWKSGLSEKAASLGLLPVFFIQDESSDAP